MDFLTFLFKKKTIQIWGKSYELDSKDPGKLDRQLRRVLLPQIKSYVIKWETRLGVKVHKVSLQRMKTRWGSCNYQRHTIRFNTLLVHLPMEYLDYVVLHELAHLLEPSHNANFKNILTTHMPDWKKIHKILRNYKF